MTVLNNRIEFVYLFDVKNGNPNGDPDAGNMPRLDPETNLGLVTDVCLKRKIRNYVASTRGEEPGYEIYVADKAVLNNQHLRAHDAVAPQGKKKGKADDQAQAAEITRFMCRTFFDIRTFGAVMTTAVNAGQVRGPVQLSFAESIEPISPLEVGITRMAVTNERDAEKERTMGSKFIVPYGLYRAHGYISASLAGDKAKGTGFSEDDLALVLEALTNMFDHDRSATRGEMSAQRLILFRHESALGNAPAAKLLNRVRVARVGQEEGGLAPARSFDDYEVTINQDGLPAGVTIEEII